MGLLPCVQVSLSAAVLLDLAREDDARWPVAGARERAESGRTYVAWCAVAQAEELAEQAGPSGVLLPTVEQAAAIDLASAGDDVAECWRHDPQQAVALVRELVTGGEFTADEVLSGAVDCAGRQDPSPGLLRVSGLPATPAQPGRWAGMDAP